MAIIKNDGRYDDVAYECILHWHLAKYKKNNKKKEVQ